MTQLFSNISCLHQFHNTHLLPALMQSSRDWHTTHRFEIIHLLLPSFQERKSVTTGLIYLVKINVLNMQNRDLKIEMG